MKTAVDNGENQGYAPYGTYGGQNTKDKIFLLSYAEAWKYFKSEAKLQHYMYRNGIIGGGIS